MAEEYAEKLVPFGLLNVRDRFHCPYSGVQYEKVDERTARLTYGKMTTYQFHPEELVKY